MLRLAREVSSWSQCPRGRRHGCVIALDGKWIVSTGYNGTGSGMAECACDGRPKAFCEAHCDAVHAEVNAVASAAKTGARLDGTVAFVTKAPCRPCLAVLTNVGVKMAVWFKDADKSDQIQFAIQMEDGEWHVHAGFPPQL